MAVKALLANCEAIDKVNRVGRLTPFYSNCMGSMKSIQLGVDITLLNLLHFCRILSAIKQV